MIYIYIYETKCIWYRCMMTDSDNNRRIQAKVSIYLSNVVVEEKEINNKNKEAFVENNRT